MNVNKAFLTLILECCVNLLWGGTSLLYEGGRQKMSEIGGEVRWQEEKSGQPGLILEK